MIELFDLKTIFSFDEALIYDQCKYLRETYSIWIWYFLSFSENSLTCKKSSETILSNVILCISQFIGEERTLYFLYTQATIIVLY